MSVCIGLFIVEAKWMIPADPWTPDYVTIKETGVIEEDVGSEQTTHGVTDVGSIAIHVKVLVNPWPQLVFHELEEERRTTRCDIVTGKGGVGKSVLAVGLAVAAARRGVLTGLGRASQSLGGDRAASKIVGQILAAEP